MKSTTQAEPAASIIRKLGGEAVVSRVTGTQRVAPYRWCYSRERGGTGGLIPQRHHPKILEYAQSNGIRLTADEFLPQPVNAPSNPSSDSTAARAPAASGGPIPKIAQSPAPVRAAEDRAVIPSPAGG